MAMAIAIEAGKKRLAASPKLRSQKANPAFNRIAAFQTPIFCATCYPIVLCVGSSKPKRLSNWGTRGSGRPTTRSRATGGSLRRV
jgi:hypothetical protein